MSVRVGFSELGKIPYHEWERGCCRRGTRGGVIDLAPLCLQPGRKTTITVPHVLSSRSIDRFKWLILFKHYILASNTIGVIELESCHAPFHHSKDQLSRSLHSTYRSEPVLPDMFKISNCSFVAPFLSLIGHSPMTVFLFFICKPTPFAVSSNLCIRI
jgi:hypothetical protein